MPLAPETERALRSAVAAAVAEELEPLRAALEPVGPALAAIPPALDRLQGQIQASELTQLRETVERRELSDLAAAVGVLRDDLAPLAQQQQARGKLLERLLTPSGAVAAAVLILTAGLFLGRLTATEYSGAVDALTGEGVELEAP